MSKCPFYQVHMHRRSHPSASAGQTRQHEPFPWCSHEHSPVSVRIATETAGEHKLKCGGDFAKCQVLERWRPRQEDF